MHVYCATTTNAFSLLPSIDVYYCYHMNNINNNYYCVVLLFKRTLFVFIIWIRILHEASQLYFARYEFWNNYDVLCDANSLRFKQYDMRLTTCAIFVSVMLSVYEQLTQHTLHRWQYQITNLISGIMHAEGSSVQPTERSWTHTSLSTLPIRRVFRRAIIWFSPCHWKVSFMFVYWYVFSTTSLWFTFTDSDTFQVHLPYFVTYLFRVTACIAAGLSPMQPAGAATGTGVADDVNNGAFSCTCWRSHCVCMWLWQSHVIRTVQCSFIASLSLCCSITN